MRTLVAALLAAGLCGCGPSASVKGTVSGLSLSAKDAAAASYWWDERGTKVAELRLVISNHPGVCTRYAANQTEAASTNLGILIVRRNESVVPAGVFGTESFVASFVQNTDACRNTLSPEQSLARINSTVTIDGVTDASIRGSFDLLFADGHLTGTFDAPVCEAMAKSQPGNESCLR